MDDKKPKEPTLNELLVELAERMEEMAEAEKEATKLYLDEIVKLRTDMQMETSSDDASAVPAGMPTINPVIS